MTRLDVTCMLHESRWRDLLEEAVYLRPISSAVGLAIQGPDRNQELREMGSVGQPPIVLAG